MRRLSVLLGLLVIFAGCGTNTTTSSSSGTSMASVASALAAHKSALRSAAAVPTDAQQMAALQLFVGMFNNAAPGADNLNQATQLLSGGMSTETLAELLASLPAFKNNFYADTLSNLQFGTQFMDNLVGTAASAANKADIASQIASVLDSGYMTRGQVMNLVISKLSLVSSSDPNWGQAALQFNNRVNVARYQAVTKAVATADLTMLQAVTADSMTMGMAENSLMNSIMMGGTNALRLMVATSGVAQDSASSGTYGLVGIEAYGYATTVGAQLTDANGSPVGSFIPAGRTGIATSVAFDGTNFLLIWEDDNNGAFNGTTGWQVWGQFISTSGQKVGSPFPISSTGVWFDGNKTMVYANGHYLVTYTKLINPALGWDSTNRYVAGRLVAPDGSIGKEFRISSGYGARESVWTNGSNFLVAWGEDQYDTEVRACIINGDGTLGTELSVNASPEKSDNPISIAWDGTNYLVVWCDQLTSGNWQVYGQKVSAAGALVGGVIPIAVDSTKNQVATTASCGPSNCLVGFVDMTNPANWMLYGQYLNLDGTLSGSRFAANTETTMQMGGFRYDNGHYWASFSSGTYYIPSVSAMGSTGGIFIQLIQ